MTFTEDYRRGRHVGFVNPTSECYGKARGFRAPCPLVFLTKYRRGVFDADMLSCCKDAMRKVCEDFGAELREFNGEDDHVHLLVEYPPKVAVSALVNSLKGVSSRRLRSEFTGRVNRHVMHGHFWSPSYFAASCGGARLSIIRQYIEQQRRPVNATSGLTPP